MNGITEVTENDILEISHIRIINLGKNRIQKWAKIHPKFIASNLTSLDLGGNEISVLEPNLFQSFKRLTNLRLARNKIENIDRNIFGEAIKVL